MKMQAAISSELLVSINQSTRRHIPQHWYLICFLCTKVIFSNDAVLFEIFCFIVTFSRIIQGDSGGRVNILKGDRIGHCEKKKFMHVYIYV